MKYFSSNNKNFYSCYKKIKVTSLGALSDAFWERGELYFCSLFLSLMFHSFAWRLSKVVLTCLLFLFVFISTAVFSSFQNYQCDFPVTVLKQCLISVVLNTFFPPFGETEFSLFSNFLVFTKPLTIIKHFQGLFKPSVSFVCLSVALCTSEAHTRKT